VSKPFNVRIYGLAVHQSRLLLLREPFMGELIVKFPGGGLEFGEGTRECLKREFKEELNLDIRIGRHIYTQDFFMPSALNPKEQILMIYYRVFVDDVSQLKLNDSEIKELIWVDLESFSKDLLSLPSDRLVAEMFLERNRSRRNDFEIGED